MYKRNEDITFLESEIHGASTRIKNIVENFESQKVMRDEEIKKIAIAAGIWERMKKINEEHDVRLENDQNEINKLKGEISKLEFVRSFLIAREGNLLDESSEERKKSL